MSFFHSLNRVASVTRIGAVLALGLALAACGGGDDVTIHNYPASTPEVLAPNPAPVLVTDADLVSLVVSTDPVSANAGMEAVVTAQVSCGDLTAAGFCAKPVVVGDLTSSIGIIMYVEFIRGGEVVYVGKLGGGDAFVPNGALVFDRPESIKIHLSISPTAVLGTELLKIGVNPSFGVAKVVGVPLLTIPNGPVTLTRQYFDDFGPGDGTFREVLLDRYTCPIGTTCTARDFKAYLRSTEGTEFATSYFRLEYMNESVSAFAAYEVSSNTFTEVFNWGIEAYFTGDFVVTFQTNLRSGVVSSQLQFFDELGRPLYIQQVSSPAGGKG